MKADRLLALLLLLQNAERRTAQELASALEVSQRTIYRDVDALAVAGVPVLADRGPAGGISLSAGYRKALTHLAEEEIRALFVANTAVLADLGLSSGLDRALDKLRGTFSDAQRRAAEKVRGRIYIDQRRWNQGDPPVDKLALLHRAVWDDRKIRLEYEDRRRSLSTRTADPFGLVSKAGVWYLVARTGEGYRSFRVDRIRDVAELAERFERPADFDLDAHWRATTVQMIENQPRGLTVTLRATPDTIDDVCSFLPYDRVDDDGLTVRVSFSSEETALRHCLVWGAGVEILDSPALCDAVVAHARKILAQYENLVAVS